MSSVVDFLEKLGQDARLRDASPEELERAMAEAQIDEPLRAAILAGDADELRSQLRQHSFMATQMDHTGTQMPSEDNTGTQMPSDNEEEKKDGEDETTEASLKGSKDCSIVA
ncbi:hypothetical protein EC912_103316 [Luteibacter rhizovicinus]|uniref:Uncharacterized protein n=1 Tax=Luteibacter rhizovicinus TaxID=242606 RepID=A0A4R3YPX3_9GAMM|nr:hypothetical protein [Luteibacter rhizovicinus]TCV94827.1 hypothetical protein EC912_103316 [Luteibacter rhizovicinus]